MRKKKSFTIYGTIKTIAVIIVATVISVVLVAVTVDEIIIIGD